MKEQSPEIFVEPTEQGEQKPFDRSWKPDIASALINVIGIVGVGQILYRLLDGTFTWDVIPYALLAVLLTSPIVILGARWLRFRERKRKAAA